MKKRLIHFLEKSEDGGVLLSRITLGIVFAETGWGKLHHLSKVIDFFRELGIPAPQLQAPFVACCELGFGVLVLLGLMARLATFPLMAIMVVAISTAKRADIASLSDLFRTSEFLYLLLLSWIALHGPGKLSLDHLKSNN